MNHLFSPSLQKPRSLEDEIRSDLDALEELLG
jgi:hypothetical protein